MNLFVPEWDYAHLITMVNPMTWMMWWYDMNVQTPISKTPIPISTNIVHTLKRLKGLYKACNVAKGWGLKEITGKKGIQMWEDHDGKVES